MPDPKDHEADGDADRTPLEEVTGERDVTPEEEHRDDAPDTSAPDDPSSD
ncbi:hypothetical protein [Streptomyces fragilis]|uniref:Uncharacterized protein n=1 Tax=Streptomyces fragilis TaxID=67301 RepID=A0ABV2YLI5_9ACTN|nr:hypothetical protein [Streptomyces fragilis]